MLVEQKKEFTMEEISKHNSEQSCWIVIGNKSNGGAKVYDITKFLSEHPGGSEILMDFAGKDADDMFEDIGHSQGARKTLNTYYIGDLKVRDFSLFFFLYRSCIDELHLQRKGY
jgi:cytochrome b involved in lipid metabolism